MGGAVVGKDDAFKCERRFDQAATVSRQCQQNSKYGFFHMRTGNTGIVFKVMVSNKLDTYM